MISFWRTSGKYGCFSNFSKHPIQIDLVWYPTTEHYYQSMKFLDPVKREMVRTQTTPKNSKIVATTLTGLRPDWETVKYEVMLDALRAKVKQHPKILKVLMETGVEELVEASPYDYIWGSGKDGTGKNLLGKAWMQIREEFRRTYITH